MKKLLDKPKAFTLIEILVVITILSIIAFATGNFNFERLWNSENSKILQNKVINQIESARNKALLGKWVDNSWTLVNPESWSVILTSTSTTTTPPTQGKIEVEYKISWILTSNNYYTYNFQTTPLEEIKIKCWGNTKNSEIITFTGNEIKATHCENNPIEITTSYQNIENTFKFDPVSGVVTRK